MLLAIKIFISEFKLDSVTKILITLNVGINLFIDVHPFRKLNKLLVSSGYFSKYLDSIV